MVGFPLQCTTNLSHDLLLTFLFLSFLSFLHLPTLSFPKLLATSHLVFLKGLFPTKISKKPSFFGCFLAVMVLVKKKQREKIVLLLKKIASKPFSFLNIKWIIETKLSKNLLAELIEFLKRQEDIMKLWNLEQPRGFTKKMITLCLFKDLEGVGYSWIEKNVKFTFAFHTKCLVHNTKLICHLLLHWAVPQIKNEGQQS